MNTILKSPRTWSIVASNLFVFYGIYMYDWTVFSVVMLFWSETIILGFFNFLRVIAFERPLVFYQEGASKIPFRIYLAVVWFLVLLVFTYGHGILLDGLLNDDSEPGFPSPGELIGFLNDVEMQYAFFAITASYAFDYIYQYLYKGQRHQMVYQEFTLIPFIRVAILQFTVIIGSLFVTLFNAPLGMLCVLVVFKILVELFLNGKQDGLREFFKKSNQKARERRESLMSKDQ